MPARLKLEGVPELKRLLRHVGGKDLQKELGQVHKSVGQLVVERAGGAHTGVGEGRGERIRTSAATREVQLLVGGSHRGGERKKQWGRVQKWPAGEAPTRPHLIQKAVEIQPQITDAYLEGIHDLLRRNGLV